MPSACTISWMVFMNSRVSTPRNGSNEHGLKITVVAAKCAFFAERKVFSETVEHLGLDAQWRSAVEVCDRLETYDESIHKQPFLEMFISVLSFDCAFKTRKQHPWESDPLNEPHGHRVSREQQSRLGHPLGKVDKILSWIVWEKLLGHVEILESLYNIVQPYSQNIFRGFHKKPSLRLHTPKVTNPTSTFTAPETSPSRRWSRWSNSSSTSSCVTKRLDLYGRLWTFVDAFWILILWQSLAIFDLSSQERHL